MTPRGPKRKSFLTDFCSLVLPVQLLTVIVMFGALIWFNLCSRSPAECIVTLPGWLAIFVFYLHYFTDRIVWRPTN